MAVVERAVGTQTAVIGTEHSLVTRTDGKTYVLVVDLTNMATGDNVEIRAKDKVKGSTTAVAVVRDVFTDDQIIDGYMSDPVPAVHSVEFTLKQTAGTGRDFDWSVRSLD